jgi:GT2 family glycosyltransferase
VLEREAGPAATAAIVVSWNGLDLLRASIPSLIKQSLPFRRIIVIDNGSRDGTADWARRHPEIELLELPRNTGFAAGANIGIRSALKDPAIACIALINNDVMLDADWHREAATALLAKPEVGSCATCLLRQSEPGTIDTAGIVWTASGLADNYLTGQPVSATGHTAHAVFGASGAAALLRRAFLEDVGLLDESFFAYQEDVDLALRGRARGWRCVLAPQARGTHAGHGSNRGFPLGGTWADFYNARNRIAVVAKSVPGAQWRCHGIHMIATQLTNLVKSFPERRAAATLAGTAHGLLRLPRSLWARRRTAASR